MDDKLKKRIAQINAGTTPAGYKKTKVGIVPEDWDTQRIKNHVKLVERPIKLEDDAEYELVTVRRAFGGVDSRGKHWGKTILVKNYYELQERDFVISKRQIAHGACGIVPSNLSGAVVSNEYNVFEAQENTDIAFFNMLMQYPYYKRLFYLMSDGVHIEKLLFKTKDWMKRTIAFPPLPEQKKIAEILTAQDSVISLLQKRIELKQQQKKALMQKLLSGEVRVGSGEWKKYEFELIFNKLNAPAKLKTKDYLEIGSIPIVDQSKKRIVGYTDDSSLKVACPSSGLIVFGDHTREVKYIRFDFAVGADGTQLIYSQAHNTKFLYYYLLNTTLPNDGYSRHFKYIKEMVFHLPPLPEQEKIAEILSAQDREIELMQQQLALEQQKKKALMQLLLTGKVRCK